MTETVLTNKKKTTRGDKRVREKGKERERKTKTMKDEQGREVC